ncbi:MAG: hypothetical protein B9S33_02550 [Pedosphaera sp. Tous-C6FEB]|jgi:hypothetical protein|nr:MAG: hypothetical protein B9S33_02550 [Pedosphaera sp. Tous-C6FEB]
MSATEQLLERVRGLDEAKAKFFLQLLDDLPAPKPAKAAKAPRKGVRAAVGWCLKYNHPFKTTEEYMRLIREGEQD